MVAFGGSGPVHASRVARKLKIPRVIFPIGAGVMSAFGLLVSPLSFDVARSLRIGLEDLTPESFDEKFHPLIEDALKLLRQSGVTDGDVHLARRLDLRYQGQGFEIEVLLPEALDTRTLLSRIPELFARQYEKIFSISLVDKPVEIVNWKVEAAGPLPNLEWKNLGREILPRGDAVKGKRPAYSPEKKGYTDWLVYDRYSLRPGMIFEGPALVEERESTCVIGTGEKVRVDDFYNLILDLETVKE
jgi:N-methylhydantoinase A